MSEIKGTEFPSGPPPANRGGKPPVRLIGVPMDLGAGRRGVDMGPSAIRIAGLHRRFAELDIQLEEGGDIRVRIPEELNYGGKRQMFLDEITHCCRNLAQRVEESLQANRFPLVVGGDHSIAVGSVTGTASFFRSQKQKVGLLWVDAHTDMNTPESSPSGNVHGMPLAALLGLGPPELKNLGDFCPKVDVANAAVVGARSIDRREAEAIRRLGLLVLTMKEVDQRGIAAVMQEALERVSDGTVGFHCSFDLDVVDPRVAPGVGTPVRGGLDYRESHLAMEMVYDSGRCVSLELVELNPVLDSGNQTGELAIELIASALGKKIL